MNNNIKISIYITISISVLIFLLISFVSIKASFGGLNLNFIEKRISDAASKRKMDGVICGHIHHAESRKIGKVDYLNCGDWVESCTALVENINGDMQLVNWSCSKKIKELLENFNTKPRLISPKIAA